MAQTLAINKYLLPESYLLIYNLGRTQPAGFTNKSKIPGGGGVDP